ncbi:MAG: FtsL-like putative cell division protein [Chitinophagales bacterium]
MKETTKNSEEKNNSSTEQKKQKGDNLSSTIKSLDNVTWLKQDWLISNIPYFLFLVVIAMFYIWNSHHGVKMVKEMRDTQEELIESQYYYNASKDTLTQKSRQSSVAEVVKEQNMYELSNPPYTILEK